MAENDDIVAWVLPGDYDAREGGFIDAKVWQEGEFTRPLCDATALAERDATIERLTKERDEAIRNLSAEARAHGLEQARSDALARERDEARAEVERKNAALVAARAMILAQSKLLQIFGKVEESPFIADIDATLTAKGGENVEG